MKKSFSFFIALAIISSLVLSGCGCKKTGLNYQANLEIWGLFDDSDAFSKVIDEYKKRNQKVGEIRYKKLTIDSYENDLRDALATGRGPDVFLVHHTWLSKHIDKLEPAPAEIQLDSGEKISLMSARKLQDAFPDVVSWDFVKDPKVYALPLSVDSLALYYNKDLLNQAGITRPPKTWEEFDEAVKKITKVDFYGNIVISGAAMGLSSDRPGNPGGGKINRATDILALLMMQSGTQMYNSDQKTAAFAEFTQSFYGKEKSPGQMALEYYAKFANAGSKEYCWNARMHNSVDSFIEGKTAMMLNYSWLISRIQDKAPKINFGVAPVPQNKDKEGRGLDIDFANYWGFAVSKNKVMEPEGGQKITATNEQRIVEAWKFLVYLTLNSSQSSGFLSSPTSRESADFDSAAEYAELQKKPAARRDLIEKQKENLLMAPFVQGNLIARSWPEPDDLAVEKIFDEMIDDVTLRGENSWEVIRQAQNAVNLLIKR